MKVFSFNDIASLNISPETCYKWVYETILHKNEMLLPSKTHMNLEGNVFCNVMPAIINNEGHLWGGVKIVTRYPQRIPALDSKIIIFDAESGQFQALMDANWITAMRTGAVAANSIITFAKSNYNTIGIIGLGNTARATLLVLLSQIGDRPLNVLLLKYKDQADLFEKRFQGYDNVHFRIIESTEQLVRSSDVVVSCATYFDSDICPDDSYQEGILIVPVHTRGFTNCDLFFDKIYADDRGHVDHFKNFNRFHYFAEVTDVLRGTSPGRKNDRERIIAYNIGIALHDLSFAVQVYKRIRENSDLYLSLTDIDMREPTEKFWL